MRDPAKIDKMINIIRAVWKESPDLRLGQLIMNISPGGQDIFYLEDDRLLDAMKDELARARLRNLRKE